MGSNKVLQVALGREESDEYKQNISDLSNRIRGKIGLFFTKLPQEEVRHLYGICASGVRQVLHIAEACRQSRQCCTPQMQLFILMCSRQCCHATFDSIGSGYAILVTDHFIWDHIYRLHQDQVKQMLALL